MNVLKYLLLISFLCLCTQVNGADKISIQLKWYHKYQFAGYYAAQLQGYFKEEGLTVELIEGGPEINHQHQLINAKSQYAVVGSEAVSSLAVGAPLILVTSIFQHAPEVLMTLKSNEILTLQDLKGKNVMLDELGVGGQIKAMLRSHGLEEGDYQSFEYDGDVFNLANQKVIAMYGYVSNEPYQLKQLGFPIDVFSPKDFGVDFYGDTLATTQQELANHPERVASVRRAVIRGWIYAIEHPEELIDYALSLKTNNPGPYDLAHQNNEAQKTIELIDASNIPIGNTSPDRWATMFDTYNRSSGGQAIFSRQFIYDEFYVDRRWHQRILFIACFALVTVLALFIWNRTLRSRLAKAVTNLDKIAFEDKLTGLPNRTSMLMFFEKCRTEQTNGLYLAILDIANLQNINRTQGFQNADRLINKTAAIIAKSVDKKDSCYSLNSGKFAVIGVAKSKSEFEQKINSLIETIYEKNSQVKLHCGGIELDLKLDNSNLTIRGELALQHAKTLKAPLLVFFNKLIVENIEKREALFRRVREAIVYDEFTIFYQPKVNVESLSIEGVEALLRWNHPEKGVIEPAHFLPEVENFPELMELLEDSVLDKIFSEVASVIGYFGSHSGFRVSINLSATKFLRSSLLEYLLTKCKRFGIETKFIEFELNESAMLEELDTAILVSQDLQNAGFHVALDDFGTGFSSLSYIQNLPVNIIKLDYSFVKHIPQDTRTGFVVEHIVSLAHRLGLIIVAEGVERKDQLDYLVELNVDIVQGFYFYKPMDIGALLKLPSHKLPFE